MGITILLHGGAGRIAEERRGAYVSGLEVARDLGFEKLERGASAIDAVLAAVVSMEDNEAAFNAGVGSALNRDGEVECDAAAIARILRDKGLCEPSEAVKARVRVGLMFSLADPHHTVFVAEHAQGRAAAFISVAWTSSLGAGLEGYVMEVSAELPARGGEERCGAARLPAPHGVEAAGGRTLSGLLCQARLVGAARPDLPGALLAALGALPRHGHEFIARRGLPS